MNLSPVKSVSKTVDYETRFSPDFLQPRLMNTTTRNRFRKEPVRVVSPFAEARDELFQQIMRCGVIDAAAEDQKDWFDNTMQYLGDRYHELAPSELDELRVLGERFAQPPKARKAV
jgi:hypothetical protein